MLFTLLLRLTSLSFTSALRPRVALSQMSILVHLWTIHLPLSLRCCELKSSPSRELHLVSLGTSNFWDCAIISRVPF
ncbi:hypothetical protein DL96DRAFT_1595686, partial [Flagelloscypha sp. PMI_526]